MDELQLRVQLEGLAFGFAVAAMATFTYGFFAECRLAAGELDLGLAGDGGLLDRGLARCPVAIPMKNSIRELRGARGWSQADLAERAGVSRQTINAIETGRYTPSLPLAIALARFFSRPVEEVFDADAAV